MPELSKLSNSESECINALANLNIFVDYGDIVSLNNKSRIDDFKQAINSYFREYVS